MNTLSEKDKRALAFFAPLWITGPAEALTLGIYNQAPASSKDALRSHWGVETKEDLLEQIDYMSNAQGHMDEYMHYHAQFLIMPDQGIEDLIQSTEDEALKNRLIIVNTHKFELMPCGGIAFDLCRGQYLASCGYEAGYLSEEEAWTSIRQTYDKFKGHFDSWDQYVLSYNVGRQFWESNLSQAYVEDQMNERYIPLFHLDGSLFKTLDTIK